LHQNVDDKAFLVDGPPEPAFLARYADDDLVEIPLVAETAGGSAAYLSGEMPEAERKAEVEPHGIARMISAGKRWRRYSGSRAIFDMQPDRRIPSAFS
jgi:hypothetical protein